MVVGLMVEEPTVEEQVVEEPPVEETEELRAELRELRRQVSELKSRDDLPDPVLTLEQYKLSKNEVLALKLIALGLNQTETSRLVSKGDDYIKRRLRDSAMFTKAYHEVRDEFNLWQEARLKFALPQVWREVDLILNSDPESFIGGENDNTDYAKALLKAKTTVIDKILRHNYILSSKVEHTVEFEGPMIQVAQDNLAIIAEHLQRLALAENRGELEARLPESKIVDITPVENALRFNSQVRREDGLYRCFECGRWVKNLKGHLSLQHSMELKQYIVLHNLNPLESLNDQRSDLAIGE